MAFEFNLDYIKTDTRAKIITAEAAVALLGGIINFFKGGIAAGFLSFVFWTTLIVSGLIVVLNICKVYQLLFVRFGNALVQGEIIYIGLYTLFYGIGSIISLFGWGASNLFAYVELGLFIADAFFHIKRPRYSSSDDQNLSNQQEA